MMGLISLNLEYPVNPVKKTLFKKSKLLRMK